jgi:hypothetical protein
MIDGGPKYVWADNVAERLFELPALREIALRVVPMFEAADVQAMHTVAMIGLFPVGPKS